MATPDGDRRFRLLVQNIPDYAIFMLDADGRVTTWNEGATRLKGYTEDEILGQYFSIFFTPEDRELGKPQYEKGMAETHGRYEGEGWRVRKDGTRFWGDEVITAVRDDAGRLTGFTKVVRDLTQRRAMEEALRESEERYRLLVGNIRDYAVFSMDPEGNITSWNPGARQVFGYGDGEIIGRHGSVLFTPEDLARGEHAKELATASAEGRASDDRWQVRRGGERFWASGVTHAIRDASGRLRGFAKVCRDLTEQKQVERQRERLLEQEKVARLQAERAVTLRDEFLAVVSHELRTPLTAILLWAKLIRSEGLPADEWPDAIESIERSAEAQRQLIEDLLDVSRVTSGKLRLNVREADVAVVVHAAVEAVRPMAQAKGVRIEAALDEPASVILADPDRLQQVVWNLLNNAVKFTDGGGQVVVRLRRDGGRLRLEVSDTGQGISPAFLPYVFDMFRQADASTTRAHGGLGLGLSICKKLVELHCGTIKADSAGEARGATFTVELPSGSSAVGGAAAVAGGPPLGAVGAVGAAGTVQTAGSADAFATGPALAGLRVLFAEDEPRTRAAVCWLLQRCGAEVTAVESAGEALMAFTARLDGDSGRYDLLLSDIAMQGQDGHELLRRVRAAERAAGRPGEIPAVALTAHAREQDRLRAADAGFQAHLSKPVELEALVDTLARLTGRGGM